MSNTQTIHQTVNQKSKPTTNQTAEAIAKNNLTEQEATYRFAYTYENHGFNIVKSM